MKVLHCPIIALYQPYLYVKGLRELGVEADYMLHNASPQELFFAREYDYNLEMAATREKKTNQAAATRSLEFFLYAARHYDVFHFHSGISLSAEPYWLWTQQLADLKYLKSIGKKIVMSWWGCDLRTPAVDLKYPWSACNVCPEEKKKFCSRPEKLETIHLALKYADVHLSGGDICAAYPFTHWMNNAIDTEEFKPVKPADIPEKYRLPPTDKVRIYHSFGNAAVRGDVKGSSYIRDAVVRLQSEGYPVELIFIDNVPNKDIKYIQTQADIVADQLLAGWYGSAGMECLSMGKPVITYIRPEVARIAPKDHPLINASPDTIYPVLKNLLDHRETLPEIGRRSREYVLRYHDYRLVAQQLKDIYETI
ncbi:MAG: hypothetical protein J5806_09625 [Lentisphaeria bacterium]|nr:hypothetical protein [Lentisphaeria bacterium]